MDMHLVGAELRAALADARQVEGGCVALAAADVPHLALPVLVAMDQQVHGLGQRGALEQAVDAMHVALTGGAAPEMQPSRKVLRQTKRRRLWGGGMPPIRDNAGDTADHATKRHPLRVCYGGLP